MCPNPLRLLAVVSMVGLFVAAVALSVTGCADTCADDEQWNPIVERCIPAEDESSGDVRDGEQQNQQDEQDDDQQDEEHPCADGLPTTISGTVTIPSGQLPLPEVAVYIPQPGSLDPIETGASCVRCEDELSGTPLTHTVTDGQGHFRLDDIPDADELSLVIEIGKWRREITVTDIDPCQDNPIDETRTRLPSHSGEGDLPQFAITTGGWDALECLMRKIGVSVSEFTTDDGDGRVHMFAGRGGTDRFDDSLHDGAQFTDAWEWWDELENLVDYDIILHNCEGSPNDGDKPEAARQALQDFTELGGRVFLSHWQNIWLDEGPSGFADVAEWTNDPVGGMDQTATGYINTSFPKGQLLHEWMHDTGTQPAGEFTINEARGTVDSIDEEIAQEWIWIEEGGTFGFGSGDYTQYFSFNTPVHAPESEQCGRVVFSDIHVSASDNSSPDNPFPTGCTTDYLTDQEKALVFMLFDLSQCIISDGKKGGPL